MQGCATTKQPDIEKTEIEKLPRFEAVASLPEKPSALKIVNDGKSYMAFDLDGANALSAYAEKAQSNTDAFNALVSVHNKVVDQRNDIADFAIQQQKRGNAYSEMYTEEFNAREQDRKLHMIERILLQLLIFGILI